MPILETPTYRDFFCMNFKQNTNKIACSSGLFIPKLQFNLQGIEDTN